MQPVLVSIGSAFVNVSLRRIKAMAGLAQELQHSVFDNHNHDCRLVALCELIEADTALIAGARSAFAQLAQVAVVITKTGPAYSTALAVSGGYLVREFFSVAVIASELDS